ncbi:MAG: hypothetical protein ACO3Z6_15550 [Pseudomonadales bacterium]
MNSGRVVFAAISLLLASQSQATTDWCSARVDTSAALLAPSLDASTEASVREELLAVCRDAQAQQKSSEATAQAASSAAGTDSTNVFGIEIRRAPDGADGYDRVRK